MAERPDGRDLVMDLRELTVTRHGRPIALTHQEFLLLEAFLRSPRQVLRRYDVTPR